MNPLRMIGKLLLADNTTRLRWYIRLMLKLRGSGHPQLARVVAFRIQNRFGVYISPMAVIAPSVSFPHPTGIVIGDGVIIGERAKIYQNVTLGGARVGDQKANNYPTIGQDTVLFAGVVVVGKVTVGANCIVGANAVVLSDVPDGAVAVGSPARIVRRREIETVAQASSAL
ncbi:serine acetyltransferase [Mesorhizobium sp. BR1-1-16]|uniref:serine O-acetyltransferase n=1 Tax=Mesorhizobium sp. BR1-1-16 TaxID=2876653 RepID=UPI001CCFE7F0|nr:serine acetyltransferase [Mesorhizobium sp. BR1-1-16]